MRELTQIRQEIDEIDDKLVKLFEQRMKCAAEVAENKRGTGKAIYDPEREKEKIAVLTGKEKRSLRKKWKKSEKEISERMQPTGI